MDGAFACPECGSSVEIGGMAPGRQVRCGFCDRLLEVPFLPRTADAPWRRRRFGRPKWLNWAWTALAIASITILAVGSFQFVRRQYDSAQQRSINHLLESSRSHESNGRLDQALIDLDTALEIARKAGPSYMSRVGDWRKRRGDLALRDAQHALDRLRDNGPESFSAGTWLNLEARAAHDPDLSSLRTLIAQQFQSALSRQVDFELASAHRDFDSGRVSESLTHCDRIAALIEQLSTDRQLTVRTQTEALVTNLVSTHGAKIQAPQGRFLFGPRSYSSELIPVIVKALDTKGYLPYRESSPWKQQWNHALYLVDMDVREDRQGTYLTTANRLARIEVRLTLSASDRRMPIFQTKPVAISRVPLPKLPVYVSSKLAMAGDQSAEIEKLLYDDARKQIDQMIAHQLSNMPGCPTDRTSAVR